MAHLTVIRQRASLSDDCISCEIRHNKQFVQLQISFIMTTLQRSVASSVSCVLQQGPQWPKTMLDTQVPAEDADVVQGGIFWLPAEEELPRRAVKRVHEKGVVEGIYGHPVVVVSRPARNSRIAHIQIVSMSFVTQRCR
jgi:hypothetical protein